MPRTRRLTPGGYVYHVLNRANAGIKIFNSRADYEEFVEALREAAEEESIRVLCWCLMPDHWHLVLWPRHEGELSEFMRRLTVTHTRRWHARRHSSGTGHLYQGRYRSFPVKPGEPLVTVCRYVESNPARSGKVKKAADWPWSSAHSSATRPGGGAKSAKSSRGSNGSVKKPTEETGDAVQGPPLSEGPPPTPRRSLFRPDTPLTAAELVALRKSVQRGTPFGPLDWQVGTARRLELESSMRARGRPRKTPVVEPVKTGKGKVVEPAPRAPVKRSGKASPITRGGIKRAASRK